MITISKMESARDQARDAARTINERQRDQARLGLGTSMTGIGGGSASDIPSLSSPTSGFQFFLFEKLIWILLTLHFQLHLSAA